MQASADLSRRCDEHARRDAERIRETVDVGPFRALLDHATDLIWLNYAVPVAPLGQDESVAAALDELRRVFSARGRALRFEFNALPWPDLPRALERAGLRLHAEHPLMVCTPESFSPIASPGVGVGMLDDRSSEVDLRAYLTILGLAFGDSPALVADADVAELRGKLAGGLHLRALATLDGAPAGAATLAPIDDIAELAGVATHPEARRRGVAATVSSFLTREHFDRGGRVAWLSAADAIAQAVYRKVGFQLIDTRLNYM